MPKNLLGFSEDTMKTALLPEKHGPPGVKVYSNGNCLYNLVSVLIKEDKTLTGTLLVLTACELSFNAEIYANHAKISKASGVHHILRKHSLL